MNIEDQVVSVELAQEMKEQGAEQDGIYVWVHPICKEDNLKDLLDETDEWELMLKKALSPFIKNERKMYAAYTVAELGEMLSTFYTSWRTAGTWACADELDQHGGKGFTAETEADARAKMWIFFKKEGLL